MIHLPYARHLGIPTPDRNHVSRHPSLRPQQHRRQPLLFKFQLGDDEAFEGRGSSMTPIAPDRLPWRLQTADESERAYVLWPRER